MARGWGPRGPLLHVALVADDLARPAVGGALAVDEPVRDLGRRAAGGDARGALGLVLSLSCFLGGHGDVFFVSMDGRGMN